MFVKLSFIFLDDSIQPPRRVQVLPGPQANTLLVSWEQSSAINITRGYRILIDGRQVQDITNPLSKILIIRIKFLLIEFLILDDHTVIPLNTLVPGRYLTVRTLTDNGGESHDSNPIDLDEILKKVKEEVIELFLINIKFYLAFLAIINNFSRFKWKRYE